MDVEAKGNPGKKGRCIVVQSATKKYAGSSEVELYKGADGIELAVRLNEDTVWLTQQEMAELFGTSRENIVQHVGNIYDDQELTPDRTCKRFLQVQMEGTRQVKRERPHYNLDMILSVGYRVRSKTATQFRQWATRVLNDHLVQGYTINQQRLDQLNKVLRIASRALEPETAGIADFVQKYLAGLILLEAYDERTLAIPEGQQVVWELGYDEARAFVDALPFGQTSDLFGRERGDAFKGVLGALYQSFGGYELYVSVQEKAANLLYLIIKDHPFFDGNKRSAAGLFVYFLDKNNALYDGEGRPFIENNTLAAVTLMIALSHPEEKDYDVRTGDEYAFCYRIG